GDDIVFVSCHGRSPFLSSTKAAQATPSGQRPETGAPDYQKANLSAMGYKEIFMSPCVTRTA
ncbi:MAG: hypothetical protein KDK08_22215, partial [Rhizobiaceae bacterium]|nr:hypothetical protein [Rhizobiaceae bacterium]